MRIAQSLSFSFREEPHSTSAIYTTAWCDMKREPSQEANKSFCCAVPYTPPKSKTCMFVEKVITRSFFVVESTVLQSMSVPDSTTNVYTESITIIDSNTEDAREHNEVLFFPKAGGVLRRHAVTIQYRV